MESYWRIFISLFIIGLINNFSYVLIAVGSEKISINFGKNELMPLFQLMLVLSTIPILILNFRYFSSIDSLLRLTTVSIVMICSFLLMSLSISTLKPWGFPLSLLSAFLMGTSQSIGECVNLGFIKAFPSDCILGFTSGTGFAGIAGSGVWLISRYMGLEDNIVFLILTPTIFIYWFCFNWIYNKAKYNLLQNPVKTKNTVMDSSQMPPYRTPTDNQIFSVEIVQSVLKNTGIWAVNLSAVYFLEYVVITGFVFKASLRYGNESFVTENFFVINQFCYQIGVWGSRSSLLMFKVERVWVVTLMQMVNFALWWMESEALALGVWGEFILTLWVGCMGGLAYVNIGYLILNSDVIPKEQKEYSMNLVLCMNSLGVVLASCFCLVLDSGIRGD